MKAEVFKNVVVERPDSKVVIELKNGDVVSATGIVIRKDKNGECVVVIKAAKTKLTLFREG